MTKKVAKKKAVKKKPKGVGKTNCASTLANLEKFCLLVHEGLNQSEAYRQTFPGSKKWTDKTLWVTACHYAKSPKVVARLAELSKERLEKHNLSIDRILEELCRLAFLDPRRFFDAMGRLRPIHELEPEVAAALTGMEVENKPGSTSVHKIKYANKMTSLDKLGQWYRMWADRAGKPGDGSGGDKPVLVIPLDMSPDEATKLYLAHIKSK